MDGELIELAQFAQNDSAVCHSYLSFLNRTKGYERAKRALTAFTDALARSELPELKKLRRTLMSWRKEILEYFRTRLTNARTEGFNNVAKLVQKRAYGYRSFRNYRLRLLNACY